MINTLFLKYFIGFILVSLTIVLLLLQQILGLGSSNPINPITLAPTQLTTPSGSIPTQQPVSPTRKITKPISGWSPSYAGYYYQILTPAAGDSISTTFVVPSVTASCNNGLASMYLWSGLTDKFNYIAQLGVNISCVGYIGGTGKVEYVAWTEKFPYYSEVIPNAPVKPGDSITATVTYLGDRKYMTTLKNTTAGWSVDTPMDPDVNFSFVPTGGEVITEIQLRDGATIKFPPITFNNSLTIGGKQVQMDVQPYVERYFMPNVATSKLNGSTFTIIYTTSLKEQSDMW